MGNVGRWTVEAARAANDPPRSLSDFSVTPITPDDGAENLARVNFGLACKSCGYGAFELGSFPVVAPDPSPYYGVAAGEALLRPPHRAKCVRCNSVGLIFDARTDGYDGVLNGGCAYESGSEGEEFFPGPYEVTVCVTYNIGASELDELASSARAETKATDLFDSLSIIATSVVGGPNLELDYECA